MYPAIADHGLIGDMQSAALVATDGTIDWFCWPRFDSPSVFASLLDERRGGRFSLAPTSEVRTVKQMYLPDTAILVTRYLSESGIAEVLDFMPLDSPTVRSEGRSIVRVIKGVRGEVRFRASVEPRFDYGRKDHRVSVEGTAAVFECGDQRMHLMALSGLESDGTDVLSETTVRAGETSPDSSSKREVQGDSARSATVTSSSSTSRPKPSGGAGSSGARTMAAGASTSNDRPSRSSSSPMRLLGVWSPLRPPAFRSRWEEPGTGTTATPGCVMARCRCLRCSGWDWSTKQPPSGDWLRARVEEGKSGVSGPLSIMYRVDGSSDLTETTLDHLDGYRGSRPVRVGNGASDQLQLDIYGEALNSLQALDGGLLGNWGIGHDGWRHVVTLIEWLCDHWREPEEGIWETRGGRRPFVYGQLMSWVALDRAIRMATSRGRPADLARWTQERDLITGTDTDQGLESGDQRVCSVRGS